MIQGTLSSDPPQLFLIRTSFSLNDEQIARKLRRQQEKEMKAQHKVPKLFFAALGQMMDSGLFFQASKDLKKKAQVEEWTKTEPSNRQKRKTDAPEEEVFENTTPEGELKCVTTSSKIKSLSLSLCVCYD